MTVQWLENGVGESDEPTSEPAVETKTKTNWAPAVVGLVLTAAVLGLVFYKKDSP